MSDEKGGGGGGGLGKLTEESLKRKERLKQLREKAGKSEKQNGEEEGGNAEKLPKPTFRNYKPQNESTEGEVITAEITDIEEVVKDEVDLLKKPLTIDEIDIASLAPRKADWDLKRDVAKKLERLERRTDKAIAELIRERLKANQNSQDLLQAVNVGTSNVGEHENENDD